MACSCAVAVGICFGRCGRIWPCVPLFYINTQMRTNRLMCKQRANMIALLLSGCVYDRCVAAKNRGATKTKQTTNSQNAHKPNTSSFVFRTIVLCLLTKKHICLMKFVDIICCYVWFSFACSPFPLNMSSSVGNAVELVFPLVTLLIHCCSLVASVEWRWVSAVASLASCTCAPTPQPRVRGYAVGGDLQEV